MALTLISTAHTLPATLSTDNHLDRTGATGATAASSVTSATSLQSTAATGDQTSVSTASGTIQKHLESSDVRADKVAALQQAISSGTYQVSAGDVADKLISGLLGE